MATQKVCIQPWLGTSKLSHTRFIHLRGRCTAMSCNCAARATYRRPNGLQSAWWKPRVAPASRPLATTPILREQSPSHFRPRITEPSIWRSIVPKFLRNDRSSSPPVKSSTTATTKPPQNFNPITVYIVLFLLIGSNAINQIGLKNDLQNYKRSTDSKIELLKEVIQRIHRGEDVDVAAALGTGNEEKEQEWEAGRSRLYYFGRHSI